MKYVLVDQVLYWKYPGGILFKCLDRSKDDVVSAELHGDAWGGHKYWKATAFNILRAGYYCPTLFTNVYLHVKSCIECQKFAGKHKLQSLPLKPITVNAPFQWWGLDFIGEIQPSSSDLHKWILIATNFFTKWVEQFPQKERQIKLSLISFKNIS